MSDQNQQENQEQPITPQSAEPAIDSIGETIVQPANAFPTAEERINKNVSCEYPTSEDFDSIDSLKPDEETVPLISHTRDYVTQYLDGNPEAERRDTPAARRWHSNFEQGFESLALGAQFEKTVTRPEGDFRQYMETEKGKVSFGAPKFADSTVAKVSGEKAQLRVRALLGLGGLVTIPLWHSGFHITIKTPSESSLIELRRRIMEDKIVLGRITHGLVFSNVSSYYAGWMLDFVLDHVYDTTLKNSTELRKKIKTPDLPVLFWGLACAVWPKGFQYVRSLATAEGVADKKIASGKINVSKLMWVDNSAFTKFQKAHMSQRVSGSMTDESLERYQQDFALTKGRSVEINEFITINLSTPSAEDYVRSGQLWLTNLMQIVESTFTDERDDIDRRNNAITEHANATIMRQFGHWVENIVVDGGEQTDRETIDSILETMSEDAESRKKFHDAVGKYIDDITVAVIAIPEVSNKGTGLERYPNLIPLDVLSVFFTLLMQRANRILNR